MTPKQLKKSNSKGSIYNAYKLSCIGLEDNVEHQDNCIQILIGCDDDDNFYNKEDEGRLKVYIETDNPNAICVRSCFNCIQRESIKTVNYGI